ncbi:MAG: tetratricopeptide repeat protein [Candidatus Omnitrophica bacterium]|nr:tetratricopeptide repeat protein [Candidatus Omnitrophota bacterium]
MRKTPWLFLFILVQPLFLSAEIYDLDYTAMDKEAEALYQESSFIRLRPKDTPDGSLPIFLYNIEKTKNPHKIPESTFKDSLFLVEKGNLRFSAGDYQEAISCYSQALELNPYLLAGLHNLGLAFFILGDYSQSIVNFKKVIDLQPFNGHPYFYLGWIYKRLENHLLAEHYLKVAKKIFQAQGELSLISQTEDLLATLQTMPQE